MSEREKKHVIIDQNRERERDVCRLESDREKVKRETEKKPFNHRPKQRTGKR